LKKEGFEKTYDATAYWGILLIKTLII